MPKPGSLATSHRRGVSPGKQEKTGSVTTEDPGLAVILRTHSDIEASVVRSLLETQDIAVLVASDVPHAVLPLSIGGLGEVRLTVRQDQADAASRLIADYRRGAAASEEEQELQLDRCEAALGYTFRDKWLLEHALTHRSRAHEDRHGDRGRQRVARVPGRCRAWSGHLGPAVSGVSGVGRRTEIQGALPTGLRTDACARR